MSFSSRRTLRLLPAPYTGALAQNHGQSAIWVFMLGQLIPPAAEVLTLHLTSQEVVPVPVVLKDGGGIGLAMAF